MKNRIEEIAQKSDEAQGENLDLNDAEMTSRRKKIETLFRTHNAALVGFLRLRLSSEQEARDVAQESYVRILQMDRPEGLRFLRSYLYKTAANLAIDHSRKKRTQTKGVKELTLFDNTEKPDQEQVLAGRQELARLRDAVAELPPKCRQAFLLSRDGWSTIRIAGHMNISDRTVRNYLHLALGHIEYCLDRSPQNAPQTASRQKDHKE